MFCFRYKLYAIWILCADKRRAIDELGEGVPRLPPARRKEKEEIKKEEEKLEGEVEKEFDETVGKTSFRRLLAVVRKTFNSIR